MTRSEIMSRIRSKNTKPEVALARALRRAGLRPKRHDRLRPGTPDFVRAKVAVFVDGDFWHGRRNVPKTNTEFWAAKFARNKRNDRRANRALKKMGWRVVRVWESELDPDAVAARLSRLLKS